MVDHTYNCDVKGTFATDQHKQITRAVEYDEIAQEYYEYDPYRYQMTAVQESTLVAEFKAALKKLEALMYVVYGAIADFANGIQWYNMPDPRCLWPEQRVYRENGSPYYEYWPHVARGSHHFGAGAKMPLQSRSGDHELQYAIVQHHPCWIHEADGTPRIWRSHNSRAAAFDPISASGVTIYAKPDLTAIENFDYIEVVKLRYGTAGENYVDMQDAGGGLYTYLIPVQSHETMVYWSVEIIYKDTLGVSQIICDGYDEASGYSVPPPNTAPPSDEHEKNPHSKYTYVVFDHSNPYAGGLPELLYEDIPSLRRGTDEHTFDKLENIDPALINIARFALQEIGRHFHQPPNNRGTGQDGAVLCCMAWPLRWRWSGSNVRGQYFAGGKGSNCEPLHNHPTHGDGGTEAMRFYWRGQPWIWGDDPLELRDFAGWPFPGYNLWFGGDETWLPIAYDCEQTVLDPGDPRYAYYGFGGVFPGACRGNAGLQNGDVIDPIHLREIIEAVDYVISAGLWTTTPFASFKKTPTDANGSPCGWVLNPRDGSPSFYDPDMDTCNDEGSPYEAPTLQDCLANAGACDKCHTKVEHTAGFDSYSTSPPGGPSWDGKRVFCLDAWSVSHPFGAGTVETICCTLGEHPDEKYLHSCTEEIMGWEAFYCPPAKTKNGWANEYYASGRAHWLPADLNHGNGVVKTRQTWGGGGFNLSYAQKSVGNSFDTVHYCADILNSEPPPSTDFTTIREVKWDGVAADWLDVCSSDADCTGMPEYPPIPGIGYWDFNQTSPLCEYQGETGSCYGTSAPGTGVYAINCGVDLNDFQFCQGCYVWVRVDLNVQNGIPTLYPYNLSIREMSDTEPQTVIGYPVSECPIQTGV